MHRSPLLPAEALSGSRRTGRSRPGLAHRFGLLATTRSELIRISRPSFLYGALGIMAGFSALITVFVFTAADEGNGRFGPSMSSLAELAAPGGFVATLTTISSLVGVVALAYWAIATATDYDTGLIRILTQAEPNRLRLLAGKVGALAVFTVVGTFLATVMATVAAWPMASVAGVSTSAWSEGFLTEFLSGWWNLTLAALVWGAIGLAIAVVTRSSGVAIAVGIGYLMVVENLIGIVAEDVTDYLPAGVLSAVAGGGTATVAYGTAIALAAAYGAAAMTGAAAVFHRREVTS